METADIEATVLSEAETELDRLGGDKALLAATEATLETPAVIGALLKALDATVARLSEWAAAVTDDDLRSAIDAASTTIEAAATDLRDVYETAGGSVDEPPAPETLPEFLVLATPESECGRVGAGLVAAPLVLDGLALQCVSFFINEADHALADACRDVRSAVESLPGDHVPTIAAVCDSAESHEAAVEGAVATVEASYEGYASTLGDMGLDPKPIC